MLDPDVVLTANAKRAPKAAEKSDLGIALPEASDDLPAIRPMVAAAAIEDVNWWPQLKSENRPVLPKLAQTQVVVRDGKGGIDPAILQFATE